MRTFMFFALIVSAGCLRKTEYKCTDSTQCGAGGQCEDVGFCSFPDSSCDSGRKFGEYSGSTYSNVCVGGTGMQVDSGVDGALIDGMMPDSSTPGCPTSYTLTSGTHKYRVIATNGTWAAHKGTCAADNNSYLAIPDDQTELDFIITSSGANRTWVGINDPADNNMFVTVKGAAYPSTAGSGLWDNTEPDNNPTNGPFNGNCAQADDSNNTLDDEACDKTRPAVCECEP